MSLLPSEEDTLKPAAKAEQEIEVHIENEPDVELEIVDDTPDEDKGRTPLPESDAEPTEEEMAAYSEAVQKRIRKEVHRYHDERRAKEAAARERDEAVAVAQRILAEKKALETRYVQGEDAFINQSKEKADLAMSQAKRAYKEAYELGDADAMADAQEKMASIAVEKREAENWAKQSTQRKENAGQEENPVVQSTQSQTATAPATDPAAQEWANKNTWFGDDDEMTQFAYGAHAKLIREGIDPGKTPSEYYKRLDSRMRTVFPNYDWGDAPTTKKKSIPSVVAPVNRTSKTAKRVTLTQSQVAVAKRMGVTPLQYAIELAKLEAA